MLTNLLAIFVVILLCGPSIALADDRVTVSDHKSSKTAKPLTAAGIDKRTPSVREVEPSEGRERETTAGGAHKPAAGGDHEPTVREKRERTVGADGGPPPASQEDDGARVLTARLKGSLCGSCLLRLEKKIQELAGVRSARVVRPDKKAGPDANERAKAQVQIVYLSSKLNPKKIRQFVERNDFSIRDEKDIALTDDFKPLPDPFENERSKGVINAQFE